MTCKNSRKTQMAFRIAPLTSRPHRKMSKECWKSTWRASRCRSSARAMIDLTRFLMQRYIITMSCVPPHPSHLWATYWQSVVWAIFSESVNGASLGHLWTYKDVCGRRRPDKSLEMENKRKYKTLSSTRALSTESDLFAKLHKQKLLKHIERRITKTCVSSSRAYCKCQFINYKNVTPADHRLSKRVCFDGLCFGHANNMHFLIVWRNRKCAKCWFSSFILDCACLNAVGLSQQHVRSH